MTSLKKLFLAILTTFAMFATATAFSEEHSITVQATGQGINKTEALEDALRNAVRKAVGTYVVTQTKLTAEDFDEDIYINADAVVTKHREIKTSEKAGIVTIAIEASVVKNDLLKYIAKTESTKITSTDLGNLLNRRKALATAEKTLEYIFQDIGSKMYLAKKKGDFSLDQDDELDTDSVKIIINYELSFNTSEYTKFEKRLKNLLKKIAIAETSGTGSYDDIHDNWNTNSCLRKFNESETSKGWPTGTQTIAFCDEYYEHDQKSYRYQCFAVPKQVYDKIDQLTPTFGTLVFDFTIKGKKETLKRYIQPELNFFKHAHYGNRSTIEFRNWMGAYIQDSWSYFTSQEYKATFSFSEDEIRTMKTCSIKTYIGQQARYIWYSCTKNDYRMQELANENYIPAMLAMAEQFEKTEWYHRAALMGNSYAQKKAGWNNAGLGFDIRVQEIYGDDLFYVESVRKGIPVKRGLALKKINGQNIPASAKDLSQLIGSFSPGTTVSIEFTNGKIIETTVQGQ